MLVTPKLEAPAYATLRSAIPRIQTKVYRSSSTREITYGLSPRCVHLASTFNGSHPDFVIMLPCVFSQSHPPEAGFKVLLISTTTIHVGYRITVICFLLVSLQQKSLIASDKLTLPSAIDDPAPKHLGSLRQG